MIHSQSWIVFLKYIPHIVPVRVLSQFQIFRFSLLCFLKRTLCFCQLSLLVLLILPSGWLWKSFRISGALVNPAFSLMHHQIFCKIWLGLKVLIDVHRFPSYCASCFYNGEPGMLSLYMKLQSLCFLPSNSFFTCCLTLLRCSIASLSCRFIFQNFKSSYVLEPYIV